MLIALVVVVAGCGGAGTPRCVTISAAGSKLCGKDALVFCQELGGNRAKRTAEACAAIEHKRKVDVVRVFFCTKLSCQADATLSQIESVRVKLKMDPRVDTVRFISKAQALAEMKKQHPDLTRDMNAHNNPLPDALEVRTNAGAGAAVAATLRPTPAGVERVQFNRR